MCGGGGGCLSFYLDGVPFRVCSLKFQDFKAQGARFKVLVLGLMFSRFRVLGLRFRVSGLYKVYTVEVRGCVRFWADFGRAFALHVVCRIWSYMSLRV